MQSLTKYFTRYQGAPDHLSRPSHNAVVHKVTSVVIPLMYRLEVHGEENLRHDGPQIYAYDHPSTVEPIITSHLANRDLRSIADEGLFNSPEGAVLTYAGAFPINRVNTSPKTLRHAEAILQQGLGLSIAPSGRCDKNRLQVPTFRRGIGGIALGGHAESIIPITPHYHPDDGTVKRPLEKALTYGAAAAVTAGAVGLAVVGAPGVAVAAAAVAGGYGLARLSKHVVRPKLFMYEALMQLGKRIGGAIVGAAAVGTGVALLAAAAPAAVPVLAAGSVIALGAAAFGIAHDWQHRDIAEYTISPPIEVQPYQDRIDRGDISHRQAETEITTDLHTAMAQAKAAMTGIPFDPSAPVIVPPGTPVAVTDAGQDGQVARAPLAR